MCGPDGSDPDGVNSRAGHNTDWNNMATQAYAEIYNAVPHFPSWPQLHLPHLRLPQYGPPCTVLLHWRLKLCTEAQRNKL